jgi:hypothetical protein
MLSAEPKCRWPIVSGDMAVALSEETSHAEFWNVNLDREPNLF